MLRPLLLLVLSAGVLLGTSLARAEPDWTRVWSQIPAKEVPMFFPGQSGYEWVMNRKDHTGAFKLTERKQNCFDCHEYDADVIGKDIVTGKTVGKSKGFLDRDVPKGRRGTYPLKLQASHDDQKIYLRFEWESAPADDLPVQDKDNEIKLSVLFDNGQNDDARMAACWTSCHMDLRSMPDANAKAGKHPKAKAYGWSDGVTKYLPVARTADSIEVSPRGGWNKLRSDAELRKLLAEGQFLDLMQYRSGAGQLPVDGYVLERRVMTGGKSLTAATATRDGNKWSVTFERLLAANAPGDHNIVPGRQYTLGVAIHENHANARYHHVSLGYTFGLDDPAAFINVQRLPVSATK